MTISKNDALTSEKNMQSVYMDVFNKENSIILFKIGGVFTVLFARQNEPVKSRELNLFTSQKLQRIKHGCTLPEAWK